MQAAEVVVGDVVDVAEDAVGDGGGDVVDAGTDGGGAGAGQRGGEAGEADPVVAGVFGDRGGLDAGGGVSRVVFSRVASVRSLEYLRDFLTRLDPWSNETTVTEFRHRAHTELGLTT